MEVHDAEEELTGIEPADVDPVECLHVDYPGLRALIMRRVRDPELAADILQDALVTTLEKFREGKIVNPGSIGGYLYRVALNHVRNFRRKDRTAVSSSEDLESLIDESSLEAADFDREHWARVARELLKEMPAPRDREILVRFYLDDESREKICASLSLTDEHFNRVIFRARNRFRMLLERRGLAKQDLLSLAAFVACVGFICSIFGWDRSGVL